MEFVDKRPVYPSGFPVYIIALEVCDELHRIIQDLNQPCGGIISLAANSNPIDFLHKMRFETTLKLGYNKWHQGTLTSLGFVQKQTELWSRNGALSPSIHLQLLCEPPTTPPWRNKPKPCISLAVSRDCPCIHNSKLLWEPTFDEKQGTNTKINNMGWGWGWAHTMH